MALEDEERPYTAIPTTKFSDVQAIQSDYTSGMISYPHCGVISSTTNYSHLLFISHLWLWLEEAVATRSASLIIHFSDTKTNALRLH